MGIDKELRLRDIRSDLSERLQAVRQKRAQAEAQVAELQQKEAVLKAMLREEDERLGAAPDSSFESNGKYSSALAQFVISAFRKQNPCSLRQLRNAAVNLGIRFGDKNPGRSLHFLLVGMQQNGLVERLRDGSWHWIAGEEPKEKSSG